MARLSATICCLLLTHGFVRGATVVAYLNEQGHLFGFTQPGVNDAESALAALATPPAASEAGQTLVSGVLPGTKVQALQTEGDTTVVDFSTEIIGGGLDEARLTTIFEQVRATLASFGVDGNIRVQAAGKLLSDYLPPTKPIEPRPAAKINAAAAVAGALAGKSIALSPGHGKFWNGSGWYTQRPKYCSPLNEEDYHNLEEMKYLDTYLTQDGATTKPYRCLDKNFGNYSTGEPWWHMAACYWEKQLGYPCSVYANSTGDCTLGSGASESNDDIRARPLASDYDNTDIYVSLHSNGFQGDCTGTSCPTGLETYYDASTEHAAWGTISQTLGTKVNTAIKNAITANADSTWTCHGTCVKNSNGAYGEIRIPDRAAILTELAFHDSCDRDADTNHLRDNFFRSTAMWGMYKGICDYFAVVPTWDYYSCEAVTNDIPATMSAGSTATVHISIRNRGVLWNVAKLFRLGAVGDSDPFTTTTRYTVGGEVGPGLTNIFTINLTAPATPGIYLTDWQMLRESVTPVKRFGPTVSKSIVVTDNQPPTVPTNLTASAVSTNQINLSWQPSTDNVGVSNYFVYRDSAWIGSSATTNYADLSVSSNTIYSYQVSARDAAGNESAKSAAVLGTTPTLTCAGNKIVEAGTAWTFDAPTAAAICSTNTITIVSTVTNAACGDTFAATRTWRATDPCGNTAECNQTVTVVDTTAPTITCSSNKTVPCGSAWIFDAPSATDAGGTNVITIVGTETNAACGQTFSATRTWQATDACGNTSQCSQTVIVVDTTAPVITCASNKTVETGAAWAFDAPTATDICGTNTITIVSTVTNLAGQDGNSFDATRTWRATDECGNTAECSQTVTVNDTPPPAPPVLLHSSTGGTLTLTWTNGVLQWAGALTGSPDDWSDVTGATSPYAPPMDAEAKFFRLRY